MKRLGRVLFVVFYIGATVTVASERSTRVVERFLDWGIPAAAPVDSESRHSADELPNFSHAEKSKRLIAELSLHSSHRPRRVVVQFEELPKVEYSPSHGVQIRGSRAPPTLI